MIISTDKIEKLLRSVFPSMGGWLPTDREYIMPSEEELAGLVEAYADRQQRYVPSLWECEEIAMAFVVDVRRGRLNALHHIPPAFRKNLAIGEALGTVWDGKKKAHQANVVIIEKEVHLLDMQIKKMWRAQRGKDDIYFVRM